MEGTAAALEGRAAIGQKSGLGHEILRHNAI